MKKSSLIKSLNAILFAFLITLTSCEKEVSKPISNESAIVSADQLVTNATYGNWLKFNDLNEYKNHLEFLKSKVESSPENVDSVLDVLETGLSIVSLRHFYNNLTEEYIQTVTDSICYAPMLLSSMVNKFGIYQIEDTIYRITKNNIFKITNGNTNLLSLTDPFVTTETIPEGQLPSTIDIIKLYNISTPLNEVIANGGGYSTRFTREDKKVIDGVTFKLVATFSLYSVPYYTEFYSKSKFEKKRNKNSWYTEWATPLTLKSINSFVVSNTPNSNGTKRFNTSYTKDGKREEIADWYWWDPYNPNITRIDVIGYNSKHTANRSGQNFLIEIYF